MIALYLAAAAAGGLLLLGLAAAVIEGRHRRKHERRRKARGGYIVPASVAEYERGCALIDDTRPQLRADVEFGNVVAGDFGDWSRRAS